MKIWVCSFALLSFSSWALETATITQTASLSAPVKVQEQKSVKKIVKTKKLSKKAKAKSECLKGNPSLSQHKKRLNRCIKRRMNSLI